MMKIKQLLYSTLALSALGVALINAPSVQAVDNQWEKPTVIYGGGLNTEEIDETLKIFGIADDDEVLQEPALGEDLVNYLGYGSGNTGSMISSVYVEKDKGSGVNVTILTPDDITTITETQYINAAITAGVEDVNIDVASIRPVTGESALTGVYKALDINGEALDQERMAVAQEELESTSAIANDAELDDEQSGQLDSAIVDIKQQLAAIKEKTDEVATAEDIERIVTETLDKYNLRDIVSADNINSLIAFFGNYQLTDAIDSAQVKEQLSNFANNLRDTLGNVWQQAEDSGLLSKISNFFSNLFHSIGNFFGGFSGE